MNSLIGNIKAFRKARGITQKKLAEMIGRTESSIRKYENGMVEPPISIAIDIYKALGIKLTLTYEVISADGDNK